MELQFYAHGKLLLTGEYFVLDGAAALAFPAAYGQHMKVHPGPGPYEVNWHALDEKGQTWLSCKFSGIDFQLLETNDTESAERLQSILKTCRNLNPEFLLARHRYSVETVLEFPRAWGLGTSSTLISMIGKWAEVNPWQLLENTFGGSGYDLACAETQHPILYRLLDGQGHSELVKLHPELYKKMHFVYLGNKQNSREGIRMYRSKGKPGVQLLNEINQLTSDFISAQDISQLTTAMVKHEKLVGKYLGITPLQEREFPDFKGALKSLGAWGGDFFAAVAE
ncbi:MAG: hypothetical protein KDC24_12975, partial [Saprospiraceae bacterium]|nr:hypothetical protein [Saprospiraceae bacterium]